MTVAVGFFDGVHLGHRRIIAGADCIFTFRNHPLAVLAPARAPRLIMSAARRVELLGTLAPTTAVEFTADLAALAPERFLPYLRRTLGAEGAVALRCGADWRFGAGAAGTPDYLRSLGVAVEVADYVSIGGERVSSSRIREKVAAGELKGAAAMLGRNFDFEAEFFRGKGEGTALGFPTMNFRPVELSLVPPCGVYEALVDGRRALANFGLAPTYGARAWTSPVLEAFFPAGVGGYVPGGVSRIELVRFLRAERKFASPAALKAQLAADLAAFKSVGKMVDDRG